ncbi:MAG: divergent PAP2 family protein [Candidatus Omnitrophica bacterium]|nr:divergent PAP2 family protein [Candidatus Omnitrophota bacterium]
MNNIMWEDLLTNRVLFVTFLGWITAQGIKIIRGIVTEKRFNFYWLLRTGGMPSAHSAAVAGLSYAVGRESGFQSPLFGLSCVFALITMFDAQTWRRSIGVQAKILNGMMEDIYEKRKVGEDRLRELVGHTPVEVLVGALLGVCMAWAVYLY